MHFLLGRLVHLASVVANRRCGCFLPNRVAGKPDDWAFTLGNAGNRRPDLTGGEDALKAAQRRVVPNDHHGLGLSQWLNHTPLAGIDSSGRYPLSASFLQASTASRRLEKEPL